MDLRKDHQKKRIERARTICKAKFERDRAEGLPFHFCAQMYHDLFYKLTGIDLRENTQ